LNEIEFNKSNNNAKNNSSLKRIGNFIKDARISRNQSIEELASDLKIGSHQLQAIEEGNEDHLPEEVFIKAMVRRISEKLKVDTDFIMKEFKAERKEVNIEEIVQEVSIKAKKNRTLKKNNSIQVFIFILISGILGLSASSLIFNLFSESFRNQVPEEKLINKN
tara:strand:+ start:3299 stop:3790 length:492 start_codon:yes stop_codon:yes gene_type:complete